MSYQDQSFYQTQFPAYTPSAPMGGTTEAASLHNTTQNDDQVYYTNSNARMPVHSLQPQQQEYQMQPTLDSTFTAEYNQNTYNQNIGLGSSMGSAADHDVYHRQGQQPYNSTHHPSPHEYTYVNQTFGAIDHPVDQSSAHQTQTNFYHQNDEILLNKKRQKYGRDRVGYCDECIGVESICGFILLLLLVLGFVICFAYLMSIKE